MNEGGSQLCHLTRREIPLRDNVLKVVYSKKWFSAAQRFYVVDLYSTMFGNEVNDDIEQKVFGPIDDNGSKSIRAYLKDDQSQWHHNFKNLFIYLDAQKLRTPKGLDWIRSRYPQLTQMQLMHEMQALRHLHCTLWAEGVRELVSAENSDVKFIISDHPVTVYNYACPPDSDFCKYPNDPDITLKGSQTIFPLDQNRCLILTNLEYAKNPKSVDPLEQRTNSSRMHFSMVNTINFINTRKLTADEVNHINYIIKSRSKEYIAAAKEEWLHPEDNITLGWEELRNTLLPRRNDLHLFGGEMFVKFEDGTVHYQDAFGRTTQPNKKLNKKTDESTLGRNDLCGCGSGRKYKVCCRNTPVDLRCSWSVLSIRERNIAFCNCIKDVLKLNKDKSWIDVRRDISDENIKTIYEFFSVLWPRDTDIYSLLPKADGVFRGLYSGLVDIRNIHLNALPVASFFDDFLIQNPIVNPNIVRPEFSPIKNPEIFKYQSLKDFLFFLDLEPFIDLGLINLIPNPVDFDIELMGAMMEIVTGRERKDEYVCNQDYQSSLGLILEGSLNSTAMMPRDVRVQFLIEELGYDILAAEAINNEFEKGAESNPLVLLQKTQGGSKGQFTHFNMVPNFEMGLLIAQVTGSILVTDSNSRWKQFMSAQHRNQGIANYPWADTVSSLTSIPTDTKFLNTFNKSQGHFALVRSVLKNVDQMVLNDSRDPGKLNSLAVQVNDITKRFAQNSDSLNLKRFRISNPEGGFYDANVQRLLASSSCLKYEQRVRSVYGIDLSQ
ncbi:hypothetical protein SMKC041_22790 [Serratia marcescens]|nr:hypothetical protein SMKC041_22790 [Serratia marcescens]